MKFTAKQLVAIGAKRKGDASLPPSKRKLKAKLIKIPGLSSETIYAPRRLIIPDPSAIGLGPTLRISIPIKTCNLLNLSRGSSRLACHAEKKEHRAHVHLALYSAAGYVSGLESVCGGLPVVRITRVAPSNGLDFDGLAAACKAVVDGIADWLGVDDRDPRVKWEYDQRRGKTYAVEIEIRRQPC